MIRALFSAASGMQAQQLNIDVISNNLSNVNTVGFKKGRAEFQELLYEQMKGPTEHAPVPLQVGHGTRLSAIQRMFSGGATNPTGNQFDLAIQGAGFFRVRRGDGTELYTRDGSFRLDGQGRLTTGSGMIVLGAEGPIRIGDVVDRIDITPDGQLNMLNRETGQPETLGTLNLALFANPSGMLALGENLWAQTVASGEPTLGQADQGAFGRVAQGYLEASNVETVEEMVNLIVAQRAYEISSKAVQSADDMMGMANNIKR